MEARLLLLVLLLCPPSHLQPPTQSLREPGSATDGADSGPLLRHAQCYNPHSPPSPYCKLNLSSNASQCHRHCKLRRTDASISCDIFSACSHLVGCFDFRFGFVGFSFFVDHGVLFCFPFVSTQTQQSFFCPFQFFLVFNVSFMLCLSVICRQIFLFCAEFSFVWFDIGFCDTHCTGVVFRVSNKCLNDDQQTITTEMSYFA